jgi:hypothetical protein
MRSLPPSLDTSRVLIPLAVADRFAAPRVHLGNVG